MDCINLMDRFGDRFKVGWDPAYDPKHRPREKLDPWYMLLEFRGGNIYPHCGEMLAVEIEHRRYIKARLQRLDSTSLKQDGDNFGAFLFHVGDFEQVAEIVMPYRRPQISAERRQELSERMTEIRQQIQEKSKRQIRESPPVAADVV